MTFCSCLSTLPACLEKVSTQRRAYIMCCAVAVDRRSDVFSETTSVSLGSSSIRDFAKKRSKLTKTRVNLGNAAVRSGSRPRDSYGKTFVVRVWVARR